MCPEEILEVLLVVEKRTTENSILKCHVASSNKINQLYRGYFAEIHTVMALAYEVWCRHPSKIRSYLSVTGDSSSQLEALTENQKLSHKLITSHDMCLDDYRGRTEEYKIDCLNWLREARRQLIELDHLLSKRSGSQVGLLSRKDPNFELLPKWLDLKKTIGSLELLDKRLKKCFPEIICRTSLNIRECKPYRENIVYIRSLLGPSDEMKGTHITTANPEALKERLIK